MAKTVATSTAPATRTNNPTMACSRFDSIAYLFPPSSTARMTVFFRQHLQIVQFLRNRRFGNAVEELSHARMRTRTHFFRGPDGNHVSLVNQHHAVGDQERAGQFVCYHDDGHVKCLFEFENE